MKVFVTGASGFIGSAIIDELLGAGHEVVGMVRSQKGADALTAKGVQAHFADLTDIDGICSGAALADSTIHTAFNHDDFTVYQASCENDRRIIEALGEVYAGTDRKLVITSALGLLPRGRMVDENDQPVPGQNPRILTEQASDAVGQKGVNVVLVRLPPTVHGEGDRGFIPMLIGIARQKGMSVYQNEPKNHWPAVHRKDAAKLYLQALEQAAPTGTRYHATAELGIPFKDIAAAIGNGLDLPVTGMDAADAAAHFGGFAHFAAMDIQASSEWTRHSLGWQPTGPQLIDDMEAVYF